MAKARYFDEDRITQLEDLIAALVKQGLTRDAIIQKAYSFNDNRCDPPFADSRIVGMVSKALENTNKQDKPPQRFQGSERRNQIVKVIRQAKAQGDDAATILHKVRTFNNEQNEPPLTDGDIKHIIDTLNAMQKTGQSSTGATSMTTSDGSNISRYAARTVTLSGGRKITMRGAEIIDLDE